MSKQNRKLLLTGVGAVVVVCVVAVLALLLPDDVPDEDVIRQALGEDLPSYWMVRTVAIAVSRRNEDAGSPLYRQRFEAVVSPREVLFVPADEGKSINPFRPVREKSAPAEEHTLHGVAATRAVNERWATTIVLDNTVAELGTPRSAFSEPVVVDGSERAARIEADLNSARELAASVAKFAPAKGVLLPMRNLPNEE